MNNKLAAIFVIMVVAFGYMYFKYSKANQRMQLQALAQKSRQADAQFARLPFGLSSLDNPVKMAAFSACNTEIGNYAILNLAPDQLAIFCRCLAVHTVTHIYPLVAEACQNPGRLNFGDAACATVDAKKPHQAKDRAQLVAQECGAWAREPQPPETAAAGPGSPGQAAWPPNGAAMNQIPPPPAGQPFGQPAGQFPGQPPGQVPNQPNNRWNGQPSGPPPSPPNSGKIFN